MQPKSAAVFISRVVVACCCLVPVCVGQDDFEAAPILYSQTQPANRISQLQRALQDGQVSLEHEPGTGYLRSLLSALQIPVESQCLVFSKTSLQLRRISPSTPRAIYFSDDLYVGFCVAGDVLEISAVDPRLGTVYYTLNQQPPADGVPVLQRQTDNCLVCHSSSRTEGVPGHLVRSLMVDAAGQPLLSAGSRNVNHTTPLADRWGGWYVTGLHGPQKHLGNLIVEREEALGTVDNSAGLNQTDLSGRFRTGSYLSAHSDIVALMVLEHQVLVHNRIARAAFTTREALHYETALNEALQNAPGTRLESTTRRMQSAADKLVEALLFCGEAPLTAPIRGTSGFAEQFATAGLRDPQGRSLRDLDLQTRMFRYPCSYLIHSQAFRELPQEMRAAVGTRLQSVLSGEDQSPKFAHLSADDRRAIREILQHTEPGL
ncbi:MAG: hypothetical protein RLZZ436_1577 [Planctomycetota bacterium]|jgi:hypothetical protein